METASSQEKTYYPKKIIDEYCLKMSSLNPDKGSPNIFMKKYSHVSIDNVLLLRSKS